MRRSLLPLIVPLILCPVSGLAQNRRSPDQDLEKLLDQLAPQDICWTSPECTPEMAEALRPADKAVVRAYQRDASRLHDATIRSLRQGTESSYALLNLLRLTNSIDDSVIETIALRTKSASSERSAELVDFLATQLVPHAPVRNTWLKYVLADPPARRTDLRSQRSLAEQAIVQHALPEDLLDAVVQRYPDILVHHGASKDHPALVASVVQKVVESPVRRTDLLHVLGTQLRADLQVFPALQKLPAGLRLRVTAYATDGSPDHQAIFLRELGKADLAAFRREFTTELPRQEIAIDLSKLEPSPEIAPGMRAVLSSPRLFRVDVHGFTEYDDPDKAKEAKGAWVSWLLQEWNAKTIPQGRRDTSKYRQTPDATDRTNPFELLLALGVDLTTHFDELASPDYDDQRARLISEWCEASVSSNAISPTLSKLSTYGPEALRSGIRCAASHHGKAEWIAPIALALEKAPDDQVIHSDTFQAVCAGRWEPSERELLAQAMARRGGPGKVLATLLRYTASDDRSQRIQLLTQAFRDFCQVPAKVLEERDLTHDFMVAVESLRTRLSLDGDWEKHRADAVSKEIDEAAGRVSPPAAIRAVFEATRDGSKEGFRRWAFSM